jgi:thioredoxin-related protein
MPALLMALLLAAIVGPAGPSAAVAGPEVRLIMVEEPGCRFCKRWEADIGGSYARSSEGRFAPLKRVRRGASEIAGLAPVVYTPTFIVVRADQEVGRITGYPGPEYFWVELDPILSSAGYFPAL